MPRGRTKTHGMVGTTIYRSWYHMLQRCSNPNNEKFKNYGARGITVCEQWKKFENFYQDMGPTWFVGATIERKDVNGNYNTSNCTWILAADQWKNKTNSLIIDTPWGPMDAKHAAYKLGIRPPTLYTRIKRWPKERWFDPPMFVVPPRNRY